MTKTVRLVFAFALLVLSVAALFIGFTQQAASAAGKTGVFVVRCDFSHFRQADPIVLPGHFPSAHEHVFFGNNSVNENSTQASMLASSTTCKDHQDTAGYWSPSLYNGTTRITPIFSFAYYNLSPNTQPFPLGLKVIAGGVGDSHWFWDCFNSGGHFTSSIPVCSGSGNYLVVRVKFPDCWNGHDLDSADHRSHMRYSSSGSCPSGWIHVPQINFFNRYPANLGGSSFHLSDGTIALHSDFWNTWQPGAQEALVNRCRNINCGQVTG